MKRLAFILALLPLFCQAQTRETYRLDEGWKFSLPSQAGSDASREVSLPHTWNRDALAGIPEYLRGTCTYRRRLSVPSGWNGRRIFLRVGAANTTAEMFVNGRLAGEHRGGNTAFAVEITDLVDFSAPNNISIKVSNARRSDVLPTAGDANVYGGLIRGVELIVAGEEIIVPTYAGTEGVLIRQKAVTGEKAECEAIVKVGGLRDNNNLSLQLAVFAGGDTVARASARLRVAGKAVTTATVPFSVANPHLWQGVDDPYMYNIGVTLLSGTKPVDRIVIATGFRSVGVDPDKGFILNGRPYPLRGVAVTQDRASDGPALLPYQVEEDFRLAREIGANAVRVKGGPHHPLFYELCDREGIIVWNDLPLSGSGLFGEPGYYNTEGFRSGGQAQSLEVVRQLYNHPSVAMWGVFSNLPARGDSPVDYVMQLNRVVKREDPSRLSAASSNADGDINFITDLIVWDQHLGWREGMPSDIDVWKEGLKAGWKNLRSGVSYCVGGSIRQQGAADRRPDYLGPWHPEGWQTRCHEEYFGALDGDGHFWGIFAGNLFDYGAALRNWGDGSGVNDCGLVTFDRKWRKDAFYLYKANWNAEEPFVYITGRRWNARNNPAQEVTVYSNREEVELIVNGESKGAVRGERGMFRWRLTLGVGENKIEAVSGGLSDSCSVTIAAPPKIRP